MPSRCHSCARRRATDGARAAPVHCGAWRLDAGLPPRGRAGSAGRAPARVGPADRRGTAAARAGISRHDGRVLFRERRIEVQPDGTWIERVRVARQALTARGGSVGIDYFPFSDRARMKVSRAWHQPPGERAERSGRSSQIDIVADDAFITDAKRRVVGMDDVRPGSPASLNSRRSSSPTRWRRRRSSSIADRSPWRGSKIVTPPGWTLRSEWLHHAAVEPARTGTTTTWELRDLPAEDDPPLAPSPVETAPWLVVSIEPPAGTVPRVAPASDWPALTEWFLSSPPHYEVTPEIRAAAERVTKEADTVPERIHAVARYVRDSVRYTGGRAGFRRLPPRARGRDAAHAPRRVQGQGGADARAARFDRHSVLPGDGEPDVRGDGSGGNRAARSVRSPDRGGAGLGGGRGGVRSGGRGRWGARAARDHRHHGRAHVDRLDLGRPLRQASARCGAGRGRIVTLPGRLSKTTVWIAGSRVSCGPATPWRSS